MFQKPGSIRSFSPPNVASTERMWLRIPNGGNEPTRDAIPKIVSALRHLSLEDIRTEMVFELTAEESEPGGSVRISFAREVALFKPERSRAPAPALASFRQARQDYAPQPKGTGKKPSPWCVRHRSNNEPMSATADALASLKYSPTNAVRRNYSSSGIHPLTIRSASKVSFHMARRGNRRCSADKAPTCHSRTPSHSHQSVTVPVS